jgi:signal transduction histidine kinase/ligand-binding sensor domain-containing protein
MCCLFNIISTAQNQAANKYRAVHWGLDEGLSQGETYHMIKDVKGFLWIGTEYGLNRFDGNSFKIYLHERNNNRSLIDNDVRNGLVEDSLHNIWIGSRRGLSRFNIKTEDFTNFVADSVKRKDLSPINPFWATNTEVLCIEGQSLITSYNIHTAAKKVLAALTGFENSFDDTSVPYSVFDGSTKTVWCLVPNPKGNAMLLEVSLYTSRIKTFPLPHYSKSTYLDAEAMCYDAARNCIWINDNEGLLQFTLSDKQFHHINALSKYEHVKDYGRFVGITLDQQGRVWFATNPLGIIIYDPGNGSVSFPFPADPVLQKETGDKNACLYTDRNGIIWSGFWLMKGIDGIFPFNAVVKHYTSSPKKDSLNSDGVLRAMDAGNGNVWIGTANGINILDTKTNKFHALQEQDLPGLHAPNGFIGVAAIDTVMQKAWLHTGNGFFKVDMLTKKCTSIIFRDLDNKTVPGEGFPEFDGQEIFITNSDDYRNEDRVHVFILKLDSDTAHEILSFANLPFNILNTVPIKDHLLFLQGDEDEKSNQAYENKNGRWLRLHTPIDSIRWTSICYIKEDDTYWVAGEKKLFHLDNNFHIIQTYGAENGLPEIPIAGLINDNNGNIWFHTDRSIEELNVKTGQIKILSEADGFEKQNFDLLPFADKDAGGNIYYCGGYNGVGFNKISPGNFISTVSSVYLRSLAINQKPFLLKASIDHTDTLTLKYNQTKIEIETGIIDFYSRGKSRIRYKLESNGLQASWQYAPYYYTIRFEGLEPGSYDLIVQASNASNEFNGPVRKLHIHISPPFWETWWFRIIAFVFVAAVTYLLFQYRSRNLRRKNIVLEEKVLHRTTELKHSLEELRSAQAQLIQSEKMASLGELTAGIAHEIQNPLNFVNNFSEASNELLDEMNEELAAGNGQSAIKIGHDVKQNLEKILHHGKRADAIVKSMLQHSRKSAGQREATDINVLCDEYLRLSYHGMRAKDKAFHAELETKFDYTARKINVIPEDIGRVLLNVCNNAFYAVTEKKKTAGGEYQPTVSVQTKKLKDTIEIIIKDNGPGISKNIVDKIFQPFFTTKPTGQGTGLGLSLAYDIINAHGGKIKVESKESEGAEFIVMLPA